jgi:ankyrin repeat protein
MCPETIASTMYTFPLLMTELPCAFYLLADSCCADSCDRADRIEVVRLLLAAGAQTQRKGADGLSAVERARRAGNQALVDMLVASR